MTELPDYVSAERQIHVAVQQPDGTQKTYNSGYDHIVFIDITDEGVWIRDQNNSNTFYPSDRILEIKLPSADAEVPEHLQKQRRH